VIVNVLMSFCTKGLRQGNLEEGFLFWGLWKICDEGSASGTAFSV
jgi:hypothetical protein